MFICFAEQIINASTITRFRKIEGLNPDTNEKDFRIECMIAMQSPELELFKLKENRDRRFQELKESVGCASDRG